MKALLSVLLSVLFFQAQVFALSGGPNYNGNGNGGAAITDIVGTYGGVLVETTDPVETELTHEQLVLGPAASWVGDCMRRDPMKRDAYECYAADCSKTAGWARTSFDRFWNICEIFPDELLQPGVSTVDNACMPLIVDDASTDPARSSTG